MSITLNQEIAKGLSGALKNDTIELPFPTIYIWAVNGQANLQQIGGAQYYGGWAVKLEETDALCAMSGLTVPKDWKKEIIAPKTGDPFDAYTTRSVFVAPIAQRFAWMKDRMHSPTYVDGARGHLQVVCFMAEMTKQGDKLSFVPWGPIVLTAKGNQGKALKESFMKWQKSIAGPISKFAPGVPAWCFYVGVGTFGKERKQVMVGEGNAQSPVTPVEALIPASEKITEKFLGELFVGEDTAALMFDLQQQSAEWLAAWKVPVIEKENGGAAPASPDGFTGHDGVSPEDELPY